jgi:hypothetical protein
MVRYNMFLYHYYYYYYYSYIWSIALYGAETWMLWAVDQKHLESFEIWYCRRMEKISWADRMRIEEVLLRVKEQRNILHEISEWKANRIGHMLGRLPSTMSYCRKDTRGDRSNRKTRKKTWEANE